MHASRPSSPAKKPSFSAPTSATTLWTARLVATLWKLAVKRARKLRSHGYDHDTASHTDIMYGSPTSDAETPEIDEASIMQDAARSVVASGIVSLADLEAVTGLRLTKNHGDEAPLVKDVDASSEAATDTSDCCSIADSEVSDEEASSPKVSDYRKPLARPISRRASSTSSKPEKWVCVGYGRYVKAQSE